MSMRVLKWLKDHWPTQKGHVADASTYDITDKHGDVIASQVIIGVMRVNEDGELEPLGTWAGLQTFEGGACVPFPQRLWFHTCGGDTHILAPNPTALEFTAGNVTGIYLGDTLLVINQGGIDFDTRIEGLSDENLLFINAGTDRVGIGTNTPGEKLEVAGNIEATGDLISGDDVIVGDDLRMTGGNRIYLDGGFANPDTTYIHSNSDRTMEFRCGGNIVFGSTRIDSNFYLPLDLRSYIRFLTMARPGTVANHAQIYGRLVGGVAYMMAQNDAGAEFNLTMDNHGSFYGNNIAWTSVAFGGGGTFVIISDANIVAGDVDDTAFQNNQELLIGTAGKYLINWNISVEASGANKHIEAGIGVDGTCNAAGRMHMETKTANEEDAFGGTAILDLAATNTISIMITNVDDNTQLEVHHVNLTVVKIGET